MPNLLLYGLCGKALATFCAAAVQDLAATLGRHARAKAMGALALQDAGLKCSFHNAMFQLKSGRGQLRTGLGPGREILERPAGKKAGYSM